MFPIATICILSMITVAGKLDHCKVSSKQHIIFLSKQCIDYIFSCNFLLSLIWNTVEVNSLECLVTEHEPVIDNATNEVITENGTAWKWWPMSEIHNAKLVACNDDWSVCRSRQLSDLRTTRNWIFGRQNFPIFTDDSLPPRPIPDWPTTTTTTTAPTTTTTLVPNKCIARGKST